jgi:CRISPR-associated protein Cmr6
VSRFYVAQQEALRAHPGLRIEKFLDIEEPQWREVANQKLDDSAYRLAFQRWESYWKTTVPDSRLCIRGRVRSRLAVGLGAKGVLEVGMRLSHSYGTPVIPASAVKGVLKGALDDGGVKSFLFGSDTSRGFAEFQDAWWIPEPKPPLVLDVVTVHHPDYYGGKGAPSDCDSPNPVQFLSVRGSFLFIADSPNRAWRDYLEAVLKQVLEKRGIGAKTAAGYGRFVFGG